jgi:hypothetical protein
MVFFYPIESRAKSPVIRIRNLDLGSARKCHSGSERALATATRRCKLQIALACFFRSNAISVKTGMFFSAFSFQYFGDANAKHLLAKSSRSSVCCAQKSGCQLYGGSHRD